MCVGAPKIKKVVAAPEPEPPPEVVNAEFMEDTKKRNAVGTKALQINKNTLAVPK